MCLNFKTCLKIEIRENILNNQLLDIGFTKATATFGMNIIVLIATPCSFVSPYLIEKLGRRPLFLSMSMLCCLEWLLLAIAQWQPSAGISSAVGFAGMSLGHIAYKLGVAALPIIILNEIVPFASKSATSEVNLFS
jgi:hypothetical protein